jgi:hypothetical protein
MADSESSVAAVSYQVSDPPNALPGLALVGVKLLGVYTLVGAASQATAFLLFLRERWDYALLSFAPAAMQLVLGIILITMAEWVVSRFLRIRTGAVPPISFDERFQAMAFSVVGVLLIVTGGAGAVQHLAEAVYAKMVTPEDDITRSVLSHIGFIEVTRPLVELIAGLILFLRGRGLASLWHRMRYGGVRVREVE